MNTVIKKTKFYFNEYISKVRWIKGMLMPVILALIMSNYLEIQCSNLSVAMTANDDNQIFSLLKTYLKFFAIGYTLKYIVNIFNVRFVAVSMRTAYKNFFYEYLSIKYANFQEVGIGEAQYNIIRRAAALSEFLTTLTMSLISNIFFLILVVHSINAMVPFNIKMKILLSMVIFFVCSSILQLQRTKLRKKVNNGLQSNSRKLYDVLFNYERIVSYSNIDIECSKYYTSMHDQAYYGVFYWVTYEAIGFMNCISFIFLNVYLIKQFNLISTVGVKELKEFMMIITKLREKVFDISRDIDEVFSNYTNLDQSIIADCPQDEQTGLATIDRFTQSIEISNLKFNFKAVNIFNSINCTFKKGEKIAITGTNGSGKSTFIKILLGLYDYSGSIKIDGIEYRDITRASIRNLISYIPQESYLFDASILDNLTIGNSDINQVKLVEFCKLYNTHTLFKSLGYSKQVGERGKNLSGGQRQKISFMRAVLKAAPILILDEATSNMDAASETELVQMINANMDTKTAVMIIHNLELLKYFDKILFFNSNTLEEQGSFEVLYSKNGNFTKFYNNTLKHK